jgi:hypothetical protein
LPFEEQEVLGSECVVLAKVMQPLVPVWIAVECCPAPAGDDEDDDSETESDSEDYDVDDGEDVDSEEESDEEDEPHAKMTLMGALAVFKKFRKIHPKRRFEIQLGIGAHKTGFQVVGTGPSRNRGPSVPGVVGGGQFRGRNMEGGGWDGLRIKTPEVCAGYGQVGLTSAVILEGVRTIEKRAFYGCSSLASVTFPDSLQTIRAEAFSRCSSLASVAFPDALQTIGESAFKRCSSLASVAFPDALQTIGAGAFYECSSLASVAFQSRKPPIASHTTGEGAFSRRCTIIIPPRDSIDPMTDYVASAMGHAVVHRKREKKLRQKGARGLTREGRRSNYKAAKSAKAHKTHLKATKDNIVKAAKMSRPIRPTPLRKQKFGTRSLLGRY